MAVDDVTEVAALESTECAAAQADVAGASAPTDAAAADAADADGATVATASVPVDATTAALRQFATLSVQRLRRYQFFASVLVYPDEQTLTAMLDGSLLTQTLELLAQTDDKPLLQRVLKAAQKTGFLTSKEHFDALRTEYTRLFYNGELVRANGAAYTSAVMDEERQVARAYKQLGIKRKANSVERADHIAYEYDFLAYLAYMEAQAFAQGDAQSAREWQQEGRDFWEAHVRDFSQQFAQALSSATDELFYRVVAGLLLYHSQD